MPHEDNRGRKWHHVRHKIRGGTYEALALATVQTARPITDNAKLVLYQDHETGDYYVRPPDEFVDGRFERLLIDTPHIEHFLSAVAIEASHQRERWGEAHDRSKSAENWFWLIGFLAGKALRAAVTGDKQTALHHTVSAAAALMQWHAAIFTDQSGAGIGRDDDLEPDGSNTA